MPHDAVGKRKRRAAARVHNVHGAQDCALNVARVDGLELKHRRTAQNRVEHAEIRVLGR